MALIENTVYDKSLSNPIPRNCKGGVWRLFEKVPARFTLYLLSLSGFIVSFIIRSDLNMAILAMVKDSKQPSADNSSKQHCYHLNGTNGTDVVVDYGGTLEWSSEVQSFVLSSFYWIYFLTQMLGGAATQKFGTKRVFGYGLLATSLCSFCIPLASETHYSFVLVIRTIQGFASGFTWSAMYGIVGHWIPLQERSRFMTSFQGYNIGTGLSYWLCGFIIANFGWQYVFYTVGSMGVIWCIMWYYLAFDCPEMHPRISVSEKEYIRNNTGTTFASIKGQKVPWCSILCSLPAWAIAITSFGRVWVTYTFIISGPQYIKSILGYNAEQNGVLSGSPFLVAYGSSLVFGFISDLLINNNVLSMTNSRKLFTFISQIIPGILCISIGYMGCNITAILIAWFVAIASLTASFAGSMANIVDIAPNFSGPVLGCTQTILMSAGIFAPLTNTLAAWRKILNIAGSISISTYAVYHIWGTSDIQSWNYVNDPLHKEENKNMIPKDDVQSSKNSSTNVTDVEDSECAY